MLHSLGWVQPQSCSTTWGLLTARWLARDAKQHAHLPYRHAQAGKQMSRGHAMAKGACSDGEAWHQQPYASTTLVDCYVTHWEARGAAAGAAVEPAGGGRAETEREGCGRTSMRQSVMRVCTVRYTEPCDRRMHVCWAGRMCDACQVTGGPPRTCLR